MEFLEPPQHAAVVDDGVIKCQLTLIRGFHLFGGLLNRPDGHEHAGTEATWLGKIKLSDHVGIITLGYDNLQA